MKGDLPRGILQEICQIDRAELRISSSSTIDQDRFGMLAVHLPGRSTHAFHVGFYSVQSMVCVRMLRENLPPFYLIKAAIALRVVKKQKGIRSGLKNNEAWLCALIRALRMPMARMQHFIFQYLTVPYLIRRGYPLGILMYFWILSNNRLQKSIGYL